MNDALRDAYDKIMANTIKDGDCLIYTGMPTSSGYGRVWVRGVGKVLVHRLAYTVGIGPIPEGMTLDHVHERGCRHKMCINLLHLEPVTHAENTRRQNAVRSAQAEKTECPKGHPYNDENTYRQRGTGYRICKPCSNEHNRQYRARQKESV